MSAEVRVEFSLPLRHLSIAAIFLLRLLIRPEQEPPEEGLEPNPGFEVVIKMTRNLFVAPYVVALIAVVVIVDLLFFRNWFWERLIANIGIVLVFAAFYLRFLKNP